MARTYFTYTGDGVRTVYPVVFALGYLQRSDVHVYTGDDPNVQLEYTWQDSATIELNTPVGEGIQLTIRRIAQRTSAINDYQNGAVLEEANLDNSFAQGLMLDEELSDGFFVGHDEELLIQHDLNLSGNNLKGVGYATLPDEAVPLAQSDAKLATGLATRVNKGGDTMVAPLSGPDATAAGHYMPRLQIAEAIDARIQSAPELSIDNFQDYGSIDQVADDQNDYGTI